MPSTIPILLIWGAEKSAGKGSSAAAAGDSSQGRSSAVRQPEQGWMERS